MARAKANARTLARSVLSRIAEEDAYATLAFDSEAKKFGLDARDTSLANEITMGVLRHQTRLDRALLKSAGGKLKASRATKNVLRVAAYQLLFLDRVPVHAVVNDAVDACKRIGGGRMAGFANKVLRVLSEDGEDTFGEDENDVNRLVAEFSCPAWIVRKIFEECGSGTRLALQALMQPPDINLRCNILRTNREELLKRLRKEVPTGEFEVGKLGAHNIRGRRLGALGRLSAFQEGLFTIQDVGAQLVTEMALSGNDGKPLRILDLCAGVGGKTTHLGELAPEGSQIVAMDNNETKLSHLSDSAKRLGITNVQVLSNDLLCQDVDVGGDFDVVVLDAPCTGLGVLRRHPEAKWRLKETGIREMAALQSRLLSLAARAVASNGKLVYAVCSFAKEEGREQIGHLLKNEAGSFQVENWMATWPHLHNADSFFAAALRKKS